MNMQEGEKRCSIITVVGPTNAGKSSIVNSMVGEKVSIVTHKVQTTRSTIRGIVNHNNTQLIFVDTPGIFIPKRNLEKIMTKTAWRSFSDTEVTMLVLDSKKGITNNVKNIISKTNPPAIALLNKIDLVNKPDLLHLSAQLNSLFSFDKIFMVSALKNDGIDDVKNYLAKISPKSPWLYPEDQITDAPLEFELSEITREKLFLRVHKEIPYKLIVETEMIKESDDNKIIVYQVIYVTSENHKKIINGKNRLTIDSIAQNARHEMKNILKKDILLNLFIKVKKEWVSNERILSNIRY